MAVIEYQPDGMGGWYVYHDTGVVEHIDATGNSVGSAYEGATAIPQGSPVPQGQAVLTDADGVPYLDENGNYLTAEQPEDAEAFHIESPGHPAYDQQTYPAFTPTGPAQSAPAAPVTDNPYETGASGSYGYGRSSGRGGYGYARSSGGGYGYSGGSGYSSSGGGGGSVPRYGDGSTHPFFGGAQRVPGGRFAAESSGGNTFVPDLPYSPARSPGSYGAGGSSGGGGGSALYRAWRDKLTSKFYPGSGAGYQSYGGYKQPKPETPPEPKMRGYARGMDPDQASAVFSRPSMMLPRVAPGLSGSSPLYQDLAAEPAYQFGLLDNSTRRAHERTATSRTINSIGGFYDDAVHGGKYPSFNELTNAFTKTKRNSTLGQMMNPEPNYYGDYYEAPLSAAASTTGSLMGAIGSTLDPRAAAGYQSYGNELMDRFAARAVNRKPGHGPMMTRWVGRRLYG